MSPKRRTSTRIANITRPWWWLALGALALAAGAGTWRPAVAQENAAPIGTVAAAELDELVGPIALYPDDLVAIVLPASTYPLQVVQAARFIEERKRDPNLSPDADWDDSVVALLNYPEVVKLLNDDLDWTYDLGTAVLNQRADVLDAIQAFRDRAYAAGNLRSDDRQTVTRADEAIAIKPADPQVIYVPYYEPARVVVYQSAPVYHYYPWRYPVYYYPYPSSYVFDTGFFWGVRSWFSIGWHTHHVHVYDWGYRSHPYFGRRYYDPWYVRNVYVNVNVQRDHVWEPRHRYGGRPVVRGYEGRVYTSREQPRVRGGTTGSAYRNRSIESTERARQAAAANRVPVPRTATAPRTAPIERSGTRTGETGAREGSYRRNGGSSQAREDARAAPSSREPRAVGAPSAMPREGTRGAAVRSAPQRSAAPPSRAPSSGDRNPAPRGDASGGSYRSGGGGGEYRGGGQQPRGSARRGSEGRSAAR